jgi:hypothetical protein
LRAVRAFSRSRWGRGFSRTASPSSTIRT